MSERKAFEVTDVWRDAPDGAVLDLTAEGRPGLWERVGERWEPIAPPPDSISITVRADGTAKAECQLCPSVCYSMEWAVRRWAAEHQCDADAEIEYEDA